jgi:hypothetical protein
MFLPLGLERQTTLSRIDQHAYTAKSGVRSNAQGSESSLVRTKLSKVPMISRVSRFQSFVRPSMLLNRALLPSAETDNETWASECGVGNDALGGCGCPPTAENCFTEPSAEAEMTVSFAVHATPQTASEWARRQDERNGRRRYEQ